MPRHMSVIILVAIVLSIPTAKACRNDVPCPSELLIFFVCVVSEDEYCDSPNDRSKHDCKFEPHSQQQRKECLE